MLAKLPVLVLAGATFVAADFKLYWFSTNVYDPSAGASTYTGIKFLSAAPDCETFRNANGLDSDFDGDVSYSGYTCDGCDENVDWNDWRPSRIEINNNNKDIFTSEPYHITLYGNGDGTYQVRDTADNDIGQCAFVENRQFLDCPTAFGPYNGIEALNCVTPNLGI